MTGFNFGQIGDIISNFFDTDYVDIKRDVDGQLQEIYSNVKCHIAFASTDNPDPATVDIKPIIQSLIIHYPLWVDINNNDFLIAKKMSNEGQLLAVYSGRCGNPVVSQGRKKVSMIMSATESEQPTPVPATNPIQITIQFFHNNSPIQDEVIIEAQQGSTITYEAPVISGYKVINCSIDNILQDSTIVTINNISAQHLIKFLYDVLTIPTGFRFLVKGLYTRNDGALANGYHFYKEFPIDSISQVGNSYIITCDSVEVEHEDNGKILKIAPGVKLGLFPAVEFVVVSSIERVDGDKVTFIADRFEPTTDEESAYVCRWYD